LNDMAAFRKFVSEPRGGMKFIAHCYEEIPRTYLYDELCGRDVSEAVTVLIGPEGDFTPDEVRMAVDAGYVSVHLGQSRLRTETAAMVAVMMMHLSAGE
jgi:16S rRNA (uracil1498-N3)-methyltransferase